MLAGSGPSAASPMVACGLRATVAIMQVLQQGQADSSPADAAWLGQAATSRSQHCRQACMQPSGCVLVNTAMARRYQLAAGLPVRLLDQSSR